VTAFIAIIGMLLLRFQFNTVASLLWSAKVHAGEIGGKKKRGGWRGCPLRL